MSLTEKITDMEAALGERSLSVAALCREAGIAETTWGRWKKEEFLPSWRKWGAAEAAFERLTAEPIEASSAA